MRTEPLRLLVRVLGAPLCVRDSGQSADAIVVLGARLGARGELTGTLEERVQAGVALWQRGVAPIFCVTGGGPPGRVEADAMARRARELGVPETALRVERSARNTAENARLCAALLQPEGCRTVWIVSQPFHLRRARLLFRKFGFRALAWHPDDSLQFRSPLLGLKWTAREYFAVARCAAMEAAQRLGGRP